MKTSKNKHEIKREKGKRNLLVIDDKLELTSLNPKIHQNDPTPPKS